MFGTSRFPSLSKRLVRVDNAVVAVAAAAVDSISATAAACEDAFFKIVSTSCTKTIKSSAVVVVAVVSSSMALVVVVVIVAASTGLGLERTKLSKDWSQDFDSMGWRSTKPFLPPACCREDHDRQFRKGL